VQLTAEQTDALQEIVNIGVGQAAGMLSEMIEFHIHLQIPEIELLSLAELQQRLKKTLGEDPLAAVHLDFAGSFSGSAQLVFPTDSAANLVSVLTGEDRMSPDLNDLKISTLSEVGNIVVNGVMGSISNVLDRPLDYAVPSYIEDDIEHLLPIDHTQSDAAVLLAQARFRFEELHVQGDIVLFFDVGSFKMLLDAISAVD
jgi:chemotaxis protein CheC